jgi:hypothetical protein
VHQYTRLKASQQHIPNQSKHSSFRYSTPGPVPCRRGLRRGRSGRSGRRRGWSRQCRRVRGRRGRRIGSGCLGRVGILRSARRCGGTEGATEGLRPGTATCASGLEDFNMALVQNGEQLFAKFLKTHLVQNVQHHVFVEKCPALPARAEGWKDAT